MPETMRYCPFCNGEDVEIVPDGHGWNVGCLPCDYKIHVADCTEEEAIRYWNTRPAEDALKAEVERLKEALTQIGIVMLYSEDEKADEIFKLCEEKVGDSLKKAYVEKLQEDVEKMGLNPNTGKRGEDE